MTTSPFRVLIVDESAVTRRLLSTIVAKIAGVVLLAAARDGRDALARINEQRPQLVLLDLDMSDMSGVDGLELLRHLAAVGVPAVVTCARSDRTRKFEALSLGALHVIERADLRSQDEPTMAAYASELTRTVGFVMRLDGVGQLTPKMAELRAGALTAEAAKVTARVIIAVAASTGGPQAIIELLAALDAELHAGILIAQHMPDGFARPFAEQLARATKFDVAELSGPERVCEGQVRIIRGGANLVVDEAHPSPGTRPSPRVGSVAVPELAEAELAPSADLMFEQLAPHLGPRLCAVVLTGMGSDGARGVESVRSHGGYVVCERPDSAAVPGMPAAAIATGCVDVVGDPRELAVHIQRFVGGLVSGRRQSGAV